MMVNADPARCQTCGVTWTAGEFGVDCPECGGGAMGRSCFVCGGACPAVWHRAVLDSNDTGDAH